MRPGPLTYYHTLKYLKWIQIKYRLIYQLKPSLRQNISPPSTARPGAPLKMQDSLPATTAWLGSEHFRFLNLDHRFEGGIDWNFKGYGKLWTYNLNYFEFLSQERMSKSEGLGFIHDFIRKEESIEDGMEPFPTSLRIIFWIKFIIRYQIADEQIDQSLYRQVRRLQARPEYHLLGNHLLENGFALLFAGVYFAEPSILAQAKKILSPQLEEQILADGAHFELSPMYHQLMLYRILDGINLMQHNQSGGLGDLLEAFRQKAVVMLGWMQQMTFANGDMPCLNDSSPGVAPAASALLSYALRLGLEAALRPLGSSGYRKIIKEKYEALVDVGPIGPDYIPGHAHSDTLNLVLYYDHQPLLVDTGTSTYEKNARRQQERSTAAHNTVQIGGEEQSEVWGGFRVARRAKINFLEEGADRISASHDGYQRIGAAHRRTLRFEKKRLIIEDFISGGEPGTAFFHFYPDRSPQLREQTISGEGWTLQFASCRQVELLPYDFAAGFNQTQKALKAVVSFDDKLHTTLQMT